MSNNQEISLEEIARISRESRSAARDRTFLKLSRMRKSESITVRLVGGWGKSVRPTFGDQSIQEGEDTYYEYEFEILQGVGDISADPGVLAVWSAPKTYFRKLDPLMRMGHRVFKITRTHMKGEKDQQGNILNIANYEILSVDQANPALAIAN